MGRKLKDLTGQKFGKWTVVEFSHSSQKPKGTYWVCKCECGTIQIIDSGNLKRGKTTNCGCSKIRYDLTGQKFGKWTVIKREENKNNNHKRPCWVCKCECGTIKIIDTYRLKNGISTHCGCDSYGKDLLGQKFGKWTVIGKDNSKNRASWICKCECGTIRPVMESNLIRGVTVSCGCIIKGAGSHFWKGGITPISIHLRKLNSQWYDDCKKEVNYTCQLTGKHSCNLHTHHLKAFNIIVLEAHDLHDIQIKEIVADYTEEELKLLEEYVAEWHKDNSNAVVLCKEVHDLFHNLYGKGDNIPEQYIEFKERYLAGEFKEILNKEE